MSPRGPRISTIPPGVPFADALARGVLDRFAAGDADYALADVTILMPNRRAIRALEAAFLRQSAGDALLLPALRPLGEVDADELMLGGLAAGGLAPGPGDDLDIPDAIPEMRRLALLTRLVARLAPGTVEDGAGPVRLARELARLMDQVETEELGFAGLGELVPDEYAAHWQTTLDFLKIVTEHWPRLLDEEGCLNPAHRRRLLLDRLADHWRESPPPGPVIAAGSTGSIPATARLLSVVAGLPQGEVVLPGLDLAMPDETWALLARGEAADQVHPQFMLQRLLARMGATRDDVRPWPLGADHAALAEAKASRAELVRRALEPAEATAAWRTADRQRLSETQRDIRYVECPGPREEAAAIATILREALETPGKRAALITPDRRLARRVRTALSRWGIEVDDSGGRPLSLTPAATFLASLATAAAQGFPPVATLALLKHPLASGGLARADFLAALRKLETRVLRGPRPAPGLHGLARAVDEAGAKGGAALLEKLVHCLAPFEALFAGGDQSLGTLLAAHLAAAEALAASDEETGAARLWCGDDGEALADFVDDIRDAGDGFGALAPATYPAVWDALIEDRVIRPRRGGHARLAIWGTIEARLQDADLVVLGGLNEGSWPPAPAADPWMSRPMRQAFGLAPPERRIGQSAHDFAQGLMAPEVVLSRAAKLDGSPTVASRWLFRLEALAEKFPTHGGPWASWAAAVDECDPPCPAAPPRPTPPLAARPARLSVTAVQEWMRDPYALYARRILKLEPLPPLDEAPGAAERGIIFHRAIETFFARVGGDLPADALDILIGEGEAAFGATLARPAVRAFWWPRFLEIAAAFVAVQVARQAHYEIVGSEVAGELEIVGRKAPFTLTAKADRIDRLRAGGAYEIIDYKTGAVPTAPQIRAGFAPQLPLEGLMVEAGAFGGIPAGAVEALSFWKLQGGETPVSATWPRDQDVAAAIAAAEVGLGRLIDAFANPATPYLSRPRPAVAGGGDYDHLARVGEWAADGSGARKGKGS